MKALVAALMGMTMLAGVPAVAKTPVAAAAKGSVYVDGKGLIRWRADNQEVRLFGADYCAFSGSDYRMAGLVHADRKKLIDEDMAHFARMGWDGMRLCSWGDWENADGVGNLITNDHSDLEDYLINTARERGINILLTPIHTYDPSFADQVGNPNYKPQGFSSLYPRPIMGTEPKAIAAETNYIKQVLNHVNAYTGRALKDEPNLLFVEMINEPIHHPENLQQSVDYINTLVDAVKSTGAPQITFHNFSQDFKIGDALAQSKVEGIDFGWYPSGLVAGHEQKGNFLQAVDNYAPMLDPRVAAKPRIVYEFDQADLNTGYMFPAMARTYRSVGAQFAAIFAYDMLETAPYNLGWQTHFINLVHTPRQAVSAVIAGEAMRRLPRKSWPAYPDDTHFGDFSVDYATDSSALNAPDAYMYAGDVKTPPVNPAKLSRIVGFGSSPVVDYEGTGAYFLDKVRDGVWRLEVYPDELLASDPFAQPQLSKIVSRLYFRNWPMTVQLADLGAGFHVTPLTVPSDTNAAAAQAQGGTFKVEPGVWLLTKADHVDPSSLPAMINRVGMREYHVNAQQTYPDLIQVVSPDAAIAGRPVNIRVRVASQTLPPDLSLYIRKLGTTGFHKPISLTRIRGAEYGVSIPASDLPAGNYEYIVSETQGSASTTFPGGVTGKPGQWPFAATDTWKLSVAAPGTPLDLFNPLQDAKMLSFVRPDEDDRTPFFTIAPGEANDVSAFTIGVPDLGKNTPDLYAAALYIGDKVAARGDAAAKAVTVRLKADGGARKTLDLFLIEKDGSSWRGRFVATGDWQTVTIPLDKLEFSKSILIPTPFPALWDYWRQGPAARAGGKIHTPDIERLELRVNQNAGETAADDGKAVEVESVRLDY